MNHKTIIVALAAVAVTLGALGAPRPVVAGDLPDVSDVRLLRKLGKYDEARKYLEEMLADKSTLEKTRRAAYNELVAVLLLSQGEEAARRVAVEALEVYPDLEADPFHDPPGVEQLYEELRATLLGRLYVATTPDHCELRLRGTRGERNLGLSPVAGVYVYPGRYTLGVSHTGLAGAKIDVDISAGDSASYQVTLKEFREVFRPRYGLALRMGTFWRDQPTTAGSQPGTARDKWEKFPSGGGGIYGYFPVSRVAVIEAGLNYVLFVERRAGGEYGGVSWADAYRLLQYVSLPLVLRMYVTEGVRFGPCFGGELGYLLSVSTHVSGEGSTKEDLDQYNPLKLSLGFGAGLEVPSGSHLFVFTVLYSFWLNSLENANEIIGDFPKPKDLRLTVGFVL